MRTGVTTFAVILLVAVSAAEVQDGWDWWNTGLDGFDEFNSFFAPERVEGSNLHAASSRSNAVSSGSRSKATSFAVAKDGGNAVSNSKAVSEGDADAEAVSRAISEDGVDAAANAEAEASATEGGKNGASAAVNVTSNGGTAEGKAKALAHTLTETENAVATAVNEAINHSQDPLRIEPLEAVTESAALAIGEITVEAYATAGVELSVEGSGVAEGTAEANAEDVDQAVAHAIASSLSEATDAYGDVASAEAVARGLVVSLAEARASSIAKAKTFEGDAVAFQQSTAKIIARPVAVAIAKSIALIVGVESFADALSFSDTNTKDDAQLVANGEADVSGQSFADAQGDSSAVAHTLAPCTGEAASCCARLERFPLVTNCKCTRSRKGKTCQFNLLKSTSGVSSWEDRETGDTCYCENILPL